MKIIFALVGISLLYSCESKNNIVIKTGLEGKPMPPIDLIAFDNLTHFNTLTIDPGKPTILYAFRPSCPYCRAQTSAIVSNIETFKDINIYMLCVSEYPLFNNYYKKFALYKYSNIKAGIDYNETFVNYFKASIVPYMAIYDKNKKLKQVLQGKSYIKTLKDIALK